LEFDFVSFLSLARLFGSLACLERAFFYLASPAGLHWPTPCLGFARVRLNADEAVLLVGLVVAVPRNALAAVVGVLAADVHDVAAAVLDEVVEAVARGLNAPFLVIVVLVGVPQVALLARVRVVERLLFGVHGAEVEVASAVVGAPALVVLAVGVPNLDLGAVVAALSVAVEAAALGVARLDFVDATVLDHFDEVLFWFGCLVRVLVRLVWV